MVGPKEKIQSKGSQMAGKSYFDISFLQIQYILPSAMRYFKCCKSIM